ncbi:MAG: ATP-binding cassette domain-containing protein, partial [Variovorax sp.]|nr:ATP-binding cassette domain-containing protein [Variovorax sp.]
PPDERASALPRAPGDGAALRLSGVNAAHAGSRVLALDDVSLTLSPGERVALIGPSGAGKSTLLALVAGDLAAQCGGMHAMPHCLLTQRTELFQDTLRDNLRLADPAANDARLLAALGAAGLAQDLRAMPAGLDTRLGEGGLGLSGGQARRLALARLLLRDVPLWLLDEPTEALDTATAHDVLRRLDAQAKGRAVVVATHLRREAALADRLIRMEEGRIVADCPRGTPAFDSALAMLRPD